VFSLARSIIRRNHSIPSSALLDCIETSVDALTATIILAGDFNTLDDVEVTSSSRNALNPIVNQPTRGANKLDRIYVNDSCYTNVKVVMSTMRSDHKAVVAYNGAPLHPLNKSRERRVIAGVAHPHNMLGSLRTLLA